MVENQQIQNKYKEAKPEYAWGINDEKTSQGDTSLLNKNTIVPIAINEMTFTAASIITSKFIATLKFACWNLRQGGSWALPGLLACEVERPRQDGRSANR